MCVCTHAITCDCLGCAVLLCLVVCLALLASFFLPSHLSLKMYNYIVIVHIIIVAEPRQGMYMYALWIVCVHVHVSESMVVLWIAMGNRQSIYNYI